MMKSIQLKPLYGLKNSKHWFIKDIKKIIVFDTLKLSGVNSQQVNNF